LGLFDETMRAFQGSEDWDMWLRVLSQYQMVGVPEALVKYRIYGESMSTNWEGMEQSRSYVVAKHFGPEEEGGPRIRRIAYGGLYFGSALTHLQRGDVARGRSALGRAFVIYPELMAKLDTFYQVCLASQPQGSRGVFQDLDFEPVAVKFLDNVNAVFGTGPLPQALVSGRPDAYGNAYAVLALVAYGCRLMSQARQYALQAIRAQPSFAVQRQVLPILIKSLLGTRFVSYMKNWRARRYHGRTA
jgi:hypothetical protein